MSETAPPAGGIHRKFRKFKGVPSQGVLGADSDSGSGDSDSESVAVAVADSVAVAESESESVAVAESETVADSVAVAESESESESEAAAVAQVEHDRVERLSTVRLRGRDGVVVDLLAASSGLEHEVTSSATTVGIEGAGQVPVACAEDLLVMKTLSMSDQRPMDRVDARGLIASATGLDRGRLALVAQRGFGRDKDLGARLDTLLEEANIG